MEGSGKAGAGGWLGRLSDGQTALLVILFGLLLYIPFAGSYGLWDPWETHYGEVARQMTTRGDYISLWWPGSPRDQDVFWSKPVLTFWVLGLAFRIAGIGLPGAPSGEMALGASAEWALRVPMCLTGVLAIFAVYWLVARMVGRRAGVLSALVLATCPMFSLIARQAMTDMVFVGPMTMALCLAAMALFDDDDAILPRKDLAALFPNGPGWLRRVSWSHDRWFYLTVGVFLFVMVPQLVIDSIQLRVRIPWGGRSILMMGAIAMIPYYAASLAFLFFAARARHRAPFYLYLAAMLCGLAVLAKGLAGLGLPVIVFAAYLAFTWNWRRLARAGLPGAIAVSVGLCVLVATPWHHAMIIRHGWAFWEELFGDNHWRRLMMGRHGDRGTFEYFLRELGYSVLPWLALAPAAFATLLTGSRRRKGGPADSPVDASSGHGVDARADERRAGVYWLGGIWLVSAYALVSLSMTKFHHYILPALPGLAIVIGCFLDRLMDARPGADRAASRIDRRILAAALIGLPLLALASVDLVKTKHAAERLLWLFSYDYVHSPTGRAWPDGLDFRAALTAFAALFAVTSVGLAFRRIKAVALVGLGLAAVAFTFFLLDVYMPRVAPYWSQKDPIAAYYKARRSPGEKLIAYMMYWRGETFYTQNEIYEGAREERTVFDMDNADQDLQAWVDRHRGRRVFFIFERSRQSRLVGLLPADTRASFTVIHDKNNKFSVAHADI